MDELQESIHISELNKDISDGCLRQRISREEADCDRRLGQITAEICARGTKLVLLAGPSASGKTTTANRLAVHLAAAHKSPVIISLDDYYIDRDRIIPGPDGKLDLEHINALDIPLFTHHIKQFFAGNDMRLPSFNFLTGRREWNDRWVHPESNNVILVEGLHGLNPLLVPEQLDNALVFRIYVAPELRISLENDLYITPQIMRLLRRIIRDYASRGTMPQQTLAMWSSVVQGESTWITPFREYADTQFNTALGYEISVLKKHVMPLLLLIHEDEYLEQTGYLLKLLEYVLPADAEDEIPPTAILREFIGGNTFYC